MRLQRRGAARREGTSSPWVHGLAWACYEGEDACLAGSGGSRGGCLVLRGASCAEVVQDRRQGRGDGGGSLAAGVPCPEGVALWLRLPA